MKIFNTIVAISLLSLSNFAFADTCNTANTGFIDISATGANFINPSPTATCQLNTNPSNNNPVTIGALMEDVFGLASGSLSLVAQLDSGTGLPDGVGSNSISFGNLAAFSYLAVHYGRGELFFAFANPITDFEIENLPRGFSNYRAFSGGDTPNAVPLPAAAWLFMSGLGLFGIGKKRSKL